MSEHRITTGAVATLVIKIHDLGAWGEDCPMTQVYAQAAEAAIGYLRNTAKGTHGKIEIIGEPKITAILATRERT